MSTKKPIISLKNVWKTYHMGEITLDVLKDVSLDVYEHDFVAILGPSGSGKSTMMNQVGVLDRPTKGQIFLEGKDVSTLTESELAHLRGQKIGFVFQQFNLIPTLTALENVLLPTIFQDIPENVRVKRAKELLTRVGLGDRMTHRPNELSGGQQQRVALARALVNNPAIVLADEPTGNLDSTSGQQVLEMLRNLHKKEKKTIVLITHDHYLAKIAQRIVYMKDGEIVKIKRRKDFKETNY
jgi:putative ABC transport system ATP-binding protein